eukprot:TRINITY_DN16203_c0_g1_i1.p1 TRINITY_DN16203_c0_g1~~TRINITY_DN16203_c0_g1_i1.p1  ORF type:complete len:335 (-),score=68.85 TRINITY_DN16203_c0_g1_i1:113-1090(-)
MSSHWSRMKGEWRDGGGAKEESTSDEDDEPSVVRVKCEQPSEDMALFAVMRNILTQRSHSEVMQLAKKLDSQGIKQSSSLKVLSKNILERKLSEQLGLGELADVLEVWSALQKSSKGNGRDRAGSSKGSSKGNSKGGKGSKSSRQRSRSPRGRGQQRSRGATPRSSSKASLGGRSSRDDEAPPLWTAIIENEVDEVQRLLQQGVSVETRYQNWTPLMAACERGHFSIALLLLEKGASTSAVNRRGRCALSFAAAPSRDEGRKEQRVSQIEIIKLLAQHGAKIDRKDERGRTPREHAEAASKAPTTSDRRWRRAEAASLLAELENS